MIGRRQLLAAGSLAFLAACSRREDVVVRASDDGFHGTYLADGWQLPDVELTDQFGRAHNLRTGWDTKVVALFFGYLNCPDVCPGIMADMAVARRRLSPEQMREITPVLITTDPARDTPDALKVYLERVDEAFVGLTGDLEVIKRVGAELKVSIEQGKQLPSGGYEVDHSTQILGIGPDRAVHVVWSTPGLQIGALREDYARLIG